MITIFLHILILLLLVFLIWFFHTNSSNICFQKTNTDTLEKLTTTIKTKDDMKELENYENNLKDWLRQESEPIYDNLEDDNTTLLADLPLQN